MNSLYRFISFPAFANLVEKQVERYVSPISWEDTYEGYLLRLIKKNDIKEVIKELMNTISPNNPEAALKNYLKLQSALRFSYGQCWTMLEESDALWRIYSHDKMAVRIETDEGQIRSLFFNVKNYSINICEVKYDLAGDCKKTPFAELLTELKNTNQIIEPFFHKRKAYEHEHEKRVIIFDTDNSAKRIVFLCQAAKINAFLKNKGKSLSSQEQTEAMLKEISSMMSLFSPEKAPKDQFFPIPDLKAYIKSVMVHPQAEEWIVSLVGTICQRTGLCFKGKSNMYERIF